MPRFGFSFIIYSLITAFWLTMSVLLIRTELIPKDAASRAVPIEHIAKLLFHDEQSSDLYIHDRGATLGSVRILPHPHAPNDHRILNFSGTMQLQGVDDMRRRISWDGALDLNADFVLQLVRLGFSVHEGGGPTLERSRVELAIDAVKREATCVWKGSDGFEDTQKYALDQAGLEQLANHLGIDTAWLRSSSITELGAPQITAHQAVLETRNGRMDTYLVTLVQSGQTILEANLSETGKILRANLNILDWTLESE
jgi:hypothetical protein